MAYGLQIFDSSGNKTLDVSDSLTKTIATFVTSTSNGSATYAELAGGRPWVAAYRVPTSTATQYGAAIVTVSGTTVSWSYYSLASGNRAPMRVFVGIY
jgi:hypothetical protein